MDMPKTLLQIVGVTPTPHSLASSAVLMIDAQQEYTTGKMPLTGVDAALKEAAMLFEKARAGNRPIIHVRHRGKGIFDPDGGGFDYAAPTQPREGDFEVIKQQINAFAGTDLGEIVEKLGVSSLIVIGFMTHMCVSSTVRAALERSIGCTVVANACATRDLPGAHGGVVKARDLHEAELAALADRFAVVVDTADDVPD